MHSERRGRAVAAIAGALAAGALLPGGVFAYRTWRSRELEHACLRDVESLKEYVRSDSWVSVFDPEQWFKKLESMDILAGMGSPRAVVPLLGFEPYRTRISSKQPEGVPATYEAVRGSLERLRPIVFSEFLRALRHGDPSIRAQAAAAIGACPAGSAQARKAFAALRALILSEEDVRVREQAAASMLGLDLDRAVGFVEAYRGSSDLRALGAITTPDRGWDFDLKFLGHLIEAIRGGHRPDGVATTLASP